MQPDTRTLCLMHIAKISHEICEKSLLCVSDIYLIWGDFSVSQYDECLWEVLKSGWFVMASFRMNGYMCSEQNNNTRLKIGSIINLIQQDYKWQRLRINLIYLWSIIQHQTLPFIAQRHNLSPLTHQYILRYLNLF